FFDGVPARDCRTAGGRSAREASMAGQSRRLVQLGVLLVLIGLLTGLVVPALAVPRLGVSAHVLGVSGGFFLAVFGLLWPQVRLGSGAAPLCCALAVHALYRGWLVPAPRRLGGAGAAEAPPPP